MSKRCQKGKRCGATCIDRREVCRIELGVEGVGKVRDLVKGGAEGGSEKEEKVKVGEDSRRAAKEILKKYADKEPATTDALSALASKHKMKMVGLEHRLKGEDSLARKIEERKGEFGGDARRAAKSLSDVNRYTMQVPAGKYGKSVNAILSELRDQGYQLRIKNYWSPDAGPYRGLNVAMTAPDGRKIELQFHTRDSLRVKGKSHGMYEDFRVSKDNAERERLWNKMVALADSIPIPKGALNVGGPESIQRISLEPI